MGRVAIAKLDKILKDSDIRKGTKTKIVETLVFPAVTYGSESWTVRKRDRKRIDAFELWTWRRMLRIPWTATRRKCKYTLYMGEFSAVEYMRVYIYGHSCINLFLTFS
jgi:hypothetical protein